MQSLAHSSTMSAEQMNLKNEERKMRMDRKGLSLPLKSSQSMAWMWEVGRKQDWRDVQIHRSSDEEIPRACRGGESPERIRDGSLEEVEFEMGL